MESMILPDNLINEQGEVFDDDFLHEMSEQLSKLGDVAREKYRNKNSSAIVKHKATRLLNSAGPGTGKSYLFRDRIKFWLPLFADDQIYVSSFVRKLVADLKTEIENDDDIAEEDQSRIDVSTLHSLARSILEISRGTNGHPLRRHIQILTDTWGAVVWDDLRQFHRDQVGTKLTWKNLSGQLHNDALNQASPWPELWKTYLILSRFYNAVGFADLICFSAEAVEENPMVVEHLLWIIDEFQDFNRAEDRLIKAVTRSAKAILIAGDDDQALYVGLKASTPDIILGYYSGDEFANAMLPFCSRCSHNVCLTAAHFIAKHRAETSATKVYLPLKLDAKVPKVQIVATWMPTTAVNYIKQFLASHADELKEHIAKMKGGKETDPFLLILSPDRTASFYDSRKRPVGKALREFVQNWSKVTLGRSADYQKVLTYCSASWEPLRNLEVRKVLDYEGYTPEQVHPLVESALALELSLFDVVTIDFTDLPGKLEGVASIATNDELDGNGKVEELKKLITLEQAEKLADELDKFPIAAITDPVEAEAEEAIETVGEMAPVEFMTIVRSKGLSAKHVMIIGCDDVNVNPKKVSPLVFFVGMTRARHSLHLLVSMQAHGHSASPYIADLPEAHCDYVAYRSEGPTALGSLKEFPGTSNALGLSDQSWCGSGA